MLRPVTSPSRFACPASNGKSRSISPGARLYTGASRLASRGVVNGSHWWMWASTIPETTPSRTRLTPRRLAADADQLLVDEFVSSVAAQLAAESGTLDAAERKLWSIGADDVHVDHPGIDLVRDALRLFLVVGHQLRAQSVRRVVRKP